MSPSRSTSHASSILSRSPSREGRPPTPRHPPEFHRRCPPPARTWWTTRRTDRKSTRLNSSHGYISYAVFCLKKKKNYRAALEKVRLELLHTNATQIQAHAKLKAMQTEQKNLLPA